MVEYSIKRCEKTIKELKEQLDTDEDELDCAQIDIKRTKKAIKYWKSELQKLKKKPKIVVGEETEWK